MAQPPNAAVFVARVWWEDGQFRARISYDVNVHSEANTETRVVTADPAEVHRQLTLWLDEAASAASSGAP